MSKIAIGDFCAHLPSGKAGVKGSYKKIGVVFRDSDTGGLSVKVDTLPLPGSGWVGWCNIFEERTTNTGDLHKVMNPVQGIDDDIPF